jgi:hypothetical protein
MLISKKLLRIIGGDKYKVTVSFYIFIKTDFSTSNSTTRTEAQDFSSLTKSPIQWVSWAFSLRKKRPRREADYSRPSSAQIKNAWTYSIRLQCVVLNEAQGQHTFCKKFSKN